MKNNINYNKMNQEEIKELIKRRRFQILVHSFIYYRLNNNIISNEEFNKWALELIELQKRFPKISEEVELYNIFSGFTNVGDAAFLPFDDYSQLENRAKQLLEYQNKKIGGES